MKARASQAIKNGSKYRVQLEIVDTVTETVVEHYAALEKGEAVLKQRKKEITEDRPIYIKNVDLADLKPATIDAALDELAAEYDEYVGSTKPKADFEPQEKEI